MSGGWGGGGDCDITDHTFVIWIQLIQSIITMSLIEPSDTSTSQSTISSEQMTFSFF